MLKKELSIKIDYLSIVFDTIKADELIRRLLRLSLDYFMIQKARVKHKDYTKLYQFGTIKVYGDRKLKDGTNWYAYCENNPVNNVDWDGLSVNDRMSLSAIEELGGTVNYSTRIIQGGGTTGIQTVATVKLGGQTKTFYDNPTGRYFQKLGMCAENNVMTEDTIMYRVSGGKAGKVGSYLSKTPQGGGLQSQLDLALNPSWGNTVENVTKVVVPKGTVIYEGVASTTKYFR